MPEYDVATRKFGDGYTQWKIHAVAGDEAGTPFDGEVALATLEAQRVAAGASLGGYSEASELSFEVEMVRDEITQEAAAIQNKPVSISANTFKVMMSVGDATKLAIALGLAAAVPQADALGAGDDADTVVMGLRNPVELSFLHSIKNSQVSDAFWDHYYMPRVTVDPNFVLTFNKNAVRNVEVIFNLQPSHQEGSVSGALTSEDLYVDQTDTQGTCKIYYQTAT